MTFGNWDRYFPRSGRLFCVMSLGDFFEIPKRPVLLHPQPEMLEVVSNSLDDLLHRFDGGTCGGRPGCFRIWAALAP